MSAGDWLLLAIAIEERGRAALDFETPETDAQVRKAFKAGYTSGLAHWGATPYTSAPAHQNPYKTPNCRRAWFDGSGKAAIEKGLPF
jgi:ribosome modulation factor